MSLFKKKKKKGSIPLMSSPGCDMNEMFSIIINFFNMFNISFCFLYWGEIVRSKYNHFFQ